MTFYYRYHTIIDVFRLMEIILVKKHVTLSY